MRLTGDYHMHSHYSGDCKMALEDIVKKAISMELKEIAITDHGPGHSGYGIDPLKYPLLRHQINELNAKYSEINILLGLEANILDEEGTLDVDEELFKHMDWLNAGYHFGSRFIVDYSYHWINFSSKFSKSQYDKAREKNTKAMVNAMKRYPIKMITHPGAKGPIDIDAVAKVAAETKTLLEINSSHGHLTVENIKKAMAYDVFFAVNSDAHVIDKIGDVAEGIKRIVESKLPIDRIYNLAD